MKRIIFTCDNCNGDFRDGWNFEAGTSQISYGGVNKIAFDLCNECFASKMNWYMKKSGGLK